jgi:hypothetical protein
VAVKSFARRSPRGQMKAGSLSLSSTPWENAANPPDV